MSERAPDLLIAGGGLAGCLAALALAERRPDLSVAIVEAGDRLGGNHIWSFFDSDVAAQDRWIVDMAGPTRWPDHEVRFPHRSRRLGIGYNSIRSEDLDAAVRARLPADRLRLGARIVELRPGEVVLEGGETLRSGAVIDARGAMSAAGVDLAWQKFLGSLRHFSRPHGVVRPVIMDARVDQSFGYRFVYLLPFSETELLVEDTYYADHAALDPPRLRRLIGDYCSRHALGESEEVREETGVLPIVLGGEAAAFWPPSAPALPRLGLAGGFFHPTTGYSLPDAVANAALLARQKDLSEPALHDLFRRRAEDLWDARAFYRSLNRMLFRAATPEHRYRVLEHFYRLPDPVIGRFYSGRSTKLDKLRTLAGRPPVPIGRALRALRGAA